MTLTVETPDGKKIVSTDRVDIISELYKQNSFSSGGQYSGWIHTIFIEFRDLCRFLIGDNFNDDELYEACQYYSRDWVENFLDEADKLRGRIFSAKTDIYNKEERKKYLGELGAYDKGTFGKRFVHIPDGIFDSRTRMADTVCYLAYTYDTMAENKRPGMYYYNLFKNNPNQEVEDIKERLMSPGGMKIRKSELRIFLYPAMAKTDDPTVCFQVYLGGVFIKDSKETIFASLIIKVPPAKT